jgi:hypothetical protein
MTATVTDLFCGAGGSSLGAPVMTWIVGRILQALEVTA